MRKHDTARPVVWRACAACRTRRPATELLRFTRRGASVVPDPGRRLGGRGVHLCPTPAAIDAALKRRAFKRVLRHAVAVEPLALKETTARALRDELRRVVLGAHRSGHVAGGEPSGSDGGSDLASVLRACGLPLDRLTHPRHAARAVWLAGSISEFTFPDPGGMNRRPVATGQPPGTDGAREETPAGKGLTAPDATDSHE